MNYFLKQLIQKIMYHTSVLLISPDKK